MFNRIHQKLGTAGFIISIVALVAALGGGAYAASGGLTGKQKKEVEKIAKSVSKPGKTGAPGPAGPAGAAGAKGDAGPAGAAGATGTAGANGANGSNGTNGTTGFTSTLPGGKTETGTWSVPNPPLSEDLSFQIPISFSIPVAKSGKAYYFTKAQVQSEEFGVEEGTEEKCAVEAGEPECVGTGCSWELFNVNATPVSATPGTLCVFEQFGELSEPTGGGSSRVELLIPGEFGVSGFGPSGAYISIEANPGPNGPTTPVSFSAVGAWAVTAPTT